MIPTLHEVLELLNVSTVSGRFAHCSTDIAAATYEGGERYYCFKCGAGGNSEGYLESLGWSVEQSRDFLSLHFPDYIPYNLAEDVDPLRKNLTPFVQACHHLLAYNEDPRIGEIRGFALEKWGLTIDDILEHNIGVAITPMLADLTTATKDALNEVNAFQSGSFKLNRHLVFPQYRNGYVDYFQTRYASHTPPKGDKHWKPLILVPKPFGYYKTKAMLKARPSDKPLIIVEGICDYINMTKMGYPCVATLTARIKSPHMISRILELHKSCKGTLVEFDNDAVSNTGQKAAEALCKILCENGVDAAPSTVGMFIASLPPALAGVDGLDISDIVTALGVADSTLRFEEKFNSLLGKDTDGTPSRDPQTYLRKMIHHADSLAQIDEVYRLLACQPALYQPRYFKAITQKFTHREKDILKNIKRFKTESANEEDLTVQEEEAVVYYHNPSQSFKFNLELGEVYSTKSGFIKASRLTEGDSGEREPVNLLCILTSKQTYLPDGSSTLSLFSQEMLSPEVIQLRGNNFPTMDIREGQNVQPYWSSAVEKPLVDKFCITYLKNNFSSVVAELNIAEVYIQIVTFLNQRIVFNDPRYPQIFALYILMTYVFEMFDAIPYMHIQGPTGSGKTEMLKCLDYMCFNPLTVVATKSAGIFRSITQSQPTLLQDEEEFKNKMSENMDKDLYQLNNVGYKKGTPIIRVDRDANGIFKAQPFQTYGPKVFAGISNIYATLKARCVPISTRLARPEDRVGMVKTREINDRPHCQAIQNKLMVWSLSCGYQLYAHSQHIAYDPGFDKLAGNRLTELYTPLLTILRTIGDPLQFESTLLGFISEQKTEQGLTTSQSLNHELLRAVLLIHKGSLPPQSHVIRGVVEWTPQHMICLRKPFVEAVRAACDPVNFVDQQDLTSRRIIRSFEANNIAKRSNLRNEARVASFSGMHKPTVGTSGPYYETIKIDITEVKNQLSQNEETFLHGV